MNKKIIIIICCCLFILLLGGCLFYKNPKVELVKMEKYLQDYGFKEINTHQYELIKEGLSQEEYLKSNSSTKKTNSLIFDTSSSIMTLNDEAAENNSIYSLSLNFNLKTLIISGYYSLNSDFTTIKYNLQANNFECQNSSKCDFLEDKIFDFIDETNNILEKCHKNINSFQD